MGERGTIFVISGTSGAGKGSIVERVKRDFPHLWWSVSWTTRPRRDHEVDGEHYHFVSESEFLDRRAAGGFLESFLVYDQWKGTPIEPIEAALAAGHDVLLEMNIDGADAVRSHFPDAVVCFVVAPSRDEQLRRLTGRDSDAPTDIERRLDEADAEEARARARGYTIVVNQDVDEAYRLVAGIISGS